MVTKFTAHPPVTGALDQITHNWTYRQFQELTAHLSELERKLQSLADFSLDSFVVASYGSVRQSSSLVSGPNLGSSWVPLEGMDQVVIESRLMDVRSPGEFSVDYPGVYNLQTEVGFNHNSSNSGRAITLRLYNVTDDVPTTLNTSIGLGRNVEVTQWTGNLVFEADEAATNNYYRWEIGGGDSITNVEWLTQSLSVNQLGEWRGPDLL